MAEPDGDFRGKEYFLKKIKSLEATIKSQSIQNSKLLRERDAAESQTRNLQVEIDRLKRHLAEALSR